MFALKDYITSEDIKNLRKNLGLTQKEFASLVGTSKPTIERWEKENAKITGPIVLLSKMINDYPDYVNRYRRKNFLSECFICIRMTSVH